MGKYEVSSVQVDDKIDIYISGDLGIANISDIRSDIIRALASKDAAHIIIDNPENLDLTFLQLLISLLKSDSYDGLVSLEMRLSDDLKNLMESTGMYSIMNKSMKKI